MLVTHIEIEIIFRQLNVIFLDLIIFLRTGPGYGGHGDHGRGRRAARPPIDQTLYGDDGNECFCRVSSIIKVSSS